MAHSTTFCVDGLIELHTNHTCALVFEKVQWLIERAPDSDDYTYQLEGQTWQEFTYAHLLKFFNLEKPDGSTGNIIGEERTLRRAIKDLVDAGLLITRRCQRGIALAVNHKTLRKVVGKENLKRYGSDLQQMSTQELENNPDLQSLSTQNPSRVTTNVHSDLQSLSTHPIYKELDSLQDKQIQKDLSSDTSPDDSHTLASLNQLLSLPTLTTLQRETLIKWVMVTRGYYPNPVDPAAVGMSKQEIRTLGNLVKKDVLTQNEIGFSTQLTERKEPKSILMFATYEDLGEPPPEGAKPTDAPFWELCAAMTCWNRVNMKWRTYFKIATEQEAAIMSQFIKQCCLELDAIHEEQPIAVEEFKAFVNWWYFEKFKKRSDDEKFFPTTQEKLRANFVPFRTLYREKMSHDQQPQ